MLLERLAERARAIGFESLRGEALDTARAAIRDTVGVALAGAAEPATAVVRDVVGPGTGATLWGGGTARPLDAATVNGTAAHALDFDDCSNTMGGHPSAPVVPAVWALAEAEDLDGRRLVAAYAAGVEVEGKLGRAVNFTHYEKGWHPTATLGTFGAAAACAHLLDLSQERFVAALGLAASMAAGIKANFGTMAKPFHVGQAARNGLMAALMARRGMAANPGALEHAQGFLDVYNGAGLYDVARLDEGGLELLEPGIAFKRHPCCASTHPAADALLAIMADNGLRADDIAAVRSWTHPRRLRHTNRPDPVSGLDAKFSVQYVLARAAQDGAVRLDRFRDEAVADARTRALMARIEAAPHPDATMDTAEHFFAEVRVRATDGRTFDARVERPLGRDRAHPLPPGALRTKFRDCAGQALPPDAVDALERAFARLEDHAVRDLAAPLSAGADVRLTEWA